MSLWLPEWESVRIGGRVALPEDVKAVWDLDKAFREKTPTRERICINGLWRWQPAKNAKGLVTPDNPLIGDVSVPADRWGYFKVPGSFAESVQMKVFAHPNWSSENMKALSAAWYQREITIPLDWTGRPHFGRGGLPQFPGHPLH